MEPGARGRQPAGGVEALRRLRDERGCSNALVGRREKETRGESRKTAGLNRRPQRALAAIGPWPGATAVAWKKKETREKAREERGSALEGAGGAAARLEALTPLA